MTVTITLETMKFYACHGVKDEERMIGGHYTVDIAYTIDTNATQTDRIEDTVNYAEIFDLVKEEIMIPSLTIEHVSMRIVTAITTHFPQIKALEVKLSKLHPPVAGEMDKASVLIKISNSA